MLRYTEELRAKAAAADGAADGSPTAREEALESLGRGEGPVGNGYGGTLRSGLLALLMEGSTAVRFTRSMFRWIGAEVGEVSGGFCQADSSQ